MPHRLPLLAALIGLATLAPAADPDPFAQLDDRWPTPTSLRRPTGAPGPDYWMQKVDYRIDVRLDEASRALTGTETITYRNNSPDPLPYLWMQLDQNRFAQDSDENASAAAPSFADMSYAALRSVLYRDGFDGGHRVVRVTSGGADVPRQILGTMMRLSPAEPVAPGGAYEFTVDWAFPLPDATATKVRGGYEILDDGNPAFAVAQWFPRMCAYTDVGGWQVKQTIGQEFALEFGDYDVSITVPADHVVGSTGTLANADECLTPEQRQRLERAKTAKAPVLVITRDEALANAETAAEGTKTWRFRAERVRDFAWCSSRSYLWDAQGFDVGGEAKMAYSYWPPEGGELWRKFSTPAVIHAVRTYSKYAFDFPYPKMISVNAPIPGMEYPMITFQSPRPEDDGTYSERTKYGLISVIIHEVGHNWFPMVVNTDERQWRWMDEGLNSFVQTLAEQEWEGDYPSRTIRADRRQSLLDYMRSDRDRPVMSAPEVLRSGGHNAYSKPTLALTVLRETVLGRETFDFAFRQYATRWMFKRPEPSDFFRSMEDASGRDLDWFWRTWFYDTDHVDVSVADVVRYRLDTGDPAVRKGRDRQKESERVRSLTSRRNEAMPKRTDAGDLSDFYTAHDEFAVRPDEIEAFEKMVSELEPEEKALLKTEADFYVVTLRNEGGMVTPVPLTLTFGDGSTESMTIPAEIWRYDAGEVQKLIVTTKPLAGVQVDAGEETGDVDADNNRFPRKLRDEEFKLRKPEKKKNVMQTIAEAAAEKEAKGKDGADR